MFVTAHSSKPGHTQALVLRQTNVDGMRDAKPLCPTLMHGKRTPTWQSLCR